MAGLVALYVLFGVISYWRSYLAGLAGHRVIFDLRLDLYQHVQRMSLSFFDRQRIGAVVSRMIGDIASAQNFVGAAFVNTAMDLASIVAIAALLVVQHWKLAIASLAVLPFYAWVTRRLNRRIREQSRAIHDQLQELSGELHEQFAAISTIQAFTHEESEARAFRKQSERYLDSVLSNVRLQSVALGTTGFLTALGPILVLWYGATEVWAERLTVGTLMAFYAYLGMLYQPIQRLTELNLILANSLAAMDRIVEVFDTYPEVRERAGAWLLGRARGDVAFEDVTFDYANERPVLEHFSLAIARAFLRDAPILILDEPTSALDAESESLIKEALLKLLAGRTALIIAHRLSTVEHADEVLVIDRGRNVEQGRHEELVRRPGGLYRRYAERQLALGGVL